VREKYGKNTLVELIKMELPIVLVVKCLHRRERSNCGGSVVFVEEMN
tara:strand:+ start:18 stop:158 length:141 start_codon:yes stop_codon:yes gene_type:complete